MTDEIQAQPKQRAVRVRELTMPDGVTAWEYSDGSIRNERGHMVTPLPGQHIITQADASKLARTRWEQSREAFAAGIAQGMGNKTPVEAWSHVGRKAAELIKDSKSARGFADLARFAGEAGGFVPMARGREELQETQQDQPVIFVMIAQYIQQLHAPADDVVEADFKD